MQRSTIAPGVALALAISLPSVGVMAPGAQADDRVPAETVLFDDVPATHRFHGSIEWLVSEGITSGSSPTTFSPSAGITRAQMAVFLWRYRESPTPSRTHAFDDVPADAAYAEAVSWLSQSGITSGIGDGRFGPSDLVSRQQMAVFLHRVMAEPLVGGSYMVAPDPAGGPGYVPMTPFDDVRIGSPATMPILWLLQAGITNGTSDSTFSPSAPVTRGQMATFLHRLPVIELRLFYAIPTGQQPPSPGLVEAIQHEMMIADEWFREQTGGFGLRIPRDASRRIPITPIALPAPVDQLQAPEELGKHLRAALPDTGNVQLVYDDLGDTTTNACGRGGGGLAMIYLASDCRLPSTATKSLSGQAMVAAHEILHAMGAVPACAPNGDSHWGIGHVTDNPQDLMYAGPERNVTGEWFLDPGRDDYYGHGRTDCLDLARHPLWSR